MPDYSCYFRIKNSTHVPLEYFGKNKPAQGHWLDDTIPSIIYPDTEVTITLKDDTWFQGSEGNIAYTVKWIQQYPCNIVFGMRLPYNATEDFPSISWTYIQCEVPEVLDIEQQQPPRTNVHPLTAFYTIRFRENIPLKVNLKKITLPDPLFPVLMEDGLCRDFAIDHPLWSAAEAGKTIVATACMNSPPKIKLVGNVGHKIRKFKLKIIGECTDNGHSSPAATIGADLPVDQNTGDFNVLVPLALNNTHEGIAWGFQGTINWKVIVRGTPGFIPVTTSPIEIYAISRSLHKFLAVQGIPLDLLRFIVLPTRNWPKASAGVINYVEYVVKRIHGESGFKYETTHGAISYASLTAWDDPTNPGSFQLGKWLKNQQITSKKACHVNCYDQAGIVGICLGFSFPDNYEDKSEQGLRWFLMKPFGFVHGDLVGWGEVNNPFFGTNEDLKLLKATDSRRQPFTCHVFCTYNGMVLDATCGPETGTSNLAAYIGTAIDHTSGSENKSYKGFGTFKDLNLHTTMAELSGNIDFNQISRDNLGDTNWEIADSDRKTKDIEHIVGVYKYEAANIPKFNTEQDLIIRFNVNKLVGEMQSTFKGSYKIDGNLYHSNITEFENGGHHVCWNLNFTDKKNNKHPVSLDIFISRYSSSSRLALRRFVGLSDNHEKVEVKQTKDGVYYQLVQGIQSRAYWVYGTLCVKLSADKAFGHDAVVSVVEGLQKFLQKNDSSDETEVSVGDPVYKDEERACLRIGKTMKVSIDAKRAVECRWSYRYGNVHMVGFEKPSGLSNTYTFELCARKPGFESVTFTFLDECYREKRTIFYVNVEPRYNI